MKNNYRKILILLVLLTIVATFTISPTFANTKTVNLKKWQCYYFGDDEDKDIAGKGSLVYSKNFKVGSAKFMVGSFVELDLRKRNKIYTYHSMTVISNKKFKSATMYEINVKTLKVKEKTVKALRIEKERRNKDIQYMAQHYTMKSSYWVPYKIVINY